MKRLLITSNTSWSVNHFFRLTLNEFLKNGFQVHIIAPEDKHTEQLIQLGCIFHPIKIKRASVNIVEELESCYSLFDHLKKIKPDCVLNFTPKMNVYSTVICKLFGFNVVNSVMGAGTLFLHSSVKTKIGRLLLRLTQPLADHTVFQNSDDLSLYLDRKIVHHKKTSKVNGIGVDLKRFMPISSPNDGVVRFILVARLLSTKGVDDYVAAARRIRSHYQIQRLAGETIPEFEFALLGFLDESHPSAVGVEKIENWHKDNVIRYLGETDDVFSVVKDYDCVVLPSYYREGIPQCLIEACSMSKPIITTNHVGCRETVIPDKSGYLIPIKSPKSLANAMIKVIEKKHEDRIAMGKIGRSLAVDKFCYTHVSSHYLDIVNKLTNKA